MVSVTRFCAMWLQQEGRIAAFTSHKLPMLLWRTACYSFSSFICVSWGSIDLKSTFIYFLSRWNFAGLVSVLFLDVLAFSWTFKSYLGCVKHTSLHLYRRSLLHWGRWVHESMNVKWIPSRTINRGMRALCSTSAQFKPVVANSGLKHV